MKKIFFLISFILFFINSFSFAENSESKESESEINFETEANTTENNEILEKKVNFSLAFEPTFIINKYKPEYSEASPFVVPISFGVVVKTRTDFYFEPRLSFFSNYYIWTKDGAVPAKLEDRTATAFSFLLDLPTMFSFEPAQKHKIEASAGLAFLFRFAVLSHDVKKNDAGYKNNTASEDVKDINKYFWKNANFLYLSTSFAYLYSFTQKISAGPEVKFYIPCGQIFSGNGMNAAMISAGIKARI